MRQHQFCPDKQQYNNPKSFLVYVPAIEEVHRILLFNMVHEPGICTYLGNVLMRLPLKP